MSDTALRDLIVKFGASLFERGLTFGNNGNISVRVDDGWLMTPAGASLGNLDPARISRLDDYGKHISGGDPTKELMLHIAMYDRRPRAGAVVHLHSTHSVAVSCMQNINPANALPPITAYYVMRIGTLPLIPYYPPGDIDLARAVAEMASRHHAVLLANHGPVVAGTSLENAVAATEELEETAKLFLMLRGIEIRPLTDSEADRLTHRFPIKV